MSKPRTRCQLSLALPPAELARWKAYLADARKDEALLTEAELFRRLLNCWEASTIMGEALFPLPFDETAEKVRTVDVSPYFSVELVT